MSGFQQFFFWCVVGMITLVFLPIPHLVKTIQTTIMISKTTKWYLAALATSDWMHEDRLICEVRRLANTFIREENHDIVVDWLLNNKIIMRRPIAMSVVTIREIPTPEHPARTHVCVIAPGYHYLQAYEYGLIAKGGRRNKKHHSVQSGVHGAYAPA